MADPHQILGVARGAGETEIRRRYLELVRLHSPEREPERFAEIRRAYDELRDPVARMKSQLFNPRSEESLGDLRQEVNRRLRALRIPTSTLLNLAERR